MKVKPLGFFFATVVTYVHVHYVIMLFPSPFLTPPISFQFFFHLSFLIYSDIHCSRFLLQEPSQFCRCCLYNRFITSLAHSVFVLFVSSSTNLPVGHVPALPKKKTWLDKSDLRVRPGGQGGAYNNSRKKKEGRAQIRRLCGTLLQQSFVCLM